MVRQLIDHGAVRYYRHGDEFWLDLIARWRDSGIGVRKFCEQNGVATSTFHKRRADLEKNANGPAAATNVVTPDACFIPVLAEAMKEPAEPIAASPAAAIPSKSAPRDSVIISTPTREIGLSEGRMAWLSGRRWGIQILT